MRSRPSGTCGSRVYRSSALPGIWAGRTPRCEGSVSGRMVDPSDCLGARPSALDRVPRGEGQWRSPELPGPDCRSGKHLDLIARGGSVIVDRVRRTSRAVRPRPRGVMGTTPVPPVPDNAVWDDDQAPDLRPAIRGHRFLGEITEMRCGVPPAKRKARAAIDEMWVPLCMIEAPTQFLKIA